MRTHDNRHSCNYAGLRFHHRRSQRGQALIFGLFSLAGGLIALFFLFNTGQLMAEKTKLVNTADVVAYSAGVMHARALNFAAYTNRAMIANEVLIAQSVSMTSWTKYVSTHAQNAPTLMWCQSQYSRPVALVLITYIPVCYLLSNPYGSVTAQALNSAVPSAAQAVVTASELAKRALQAAQVNMVATLLPARASLMQQVADANYVNDGSVHVDTIPLTDHFTLFNGKPFITRYSGANRKRFKDVTLEAANLDPFIQRRSWTSANIFPCILGNKAEFRKRGGTEMIAFDEWRAMDTGSLHEWEWNIHLFSVSCDESETPIGYGGQEAGRGRGGNNGFGGSTADNRSASSLASSTIWKYSGLPSFFELSDTALKATDDAPPLLRFSIRLTRAKSQIRNSEGSSLVKPTGRLARFDSKLASDVLAAVSTSEVFFQRPTKRSDGRTELSSLFNPYWQVHLISTSSADVAQAIARGGLQ